MADIATIISITFLNDTITILSAVFFMSFFLSFFFFFLFFRFFNCYTARRVSYYVTIIIIALLEKGGRGKERKARTRAVLVPPLVRLLFQYC